ncbi:hypothetical protein BT69DRAFT_1337948 [Atractiella rhizophila]|nr:hypothetical protein BT69DRAFT_1337948 [Atractiella rhizophila]
MSYSAVPREDPIDTLGDEDEQEEGSPLLGKSTGSLKEIGTAGFTSSIANLCNTILGTGMLAMPHAIASVGIIPGALTVVFSGFTASLGLYLLARSAQTTKSRHTSFSLLSKLTFPSLGVFFDIAIALKCFGVSISYLIIIGGLMPQVVLSFTPSGSKPPIELLDRRLWIVLAMLILVPLAFLRKLDSLRHTSYIALIAVLDLIIVVVLKYLKPTGIPPPQGIELVRLTPDFFRSLPVYVFAYTCSQNIFSVHNELFDNTQRRMNIVIGTSLGSATIIYLLIGILGYLTFGADIGSNIMEMYPSSPFVSICRVAIVILVLFSYPLQVHPCRGALDKAVGFFTKKDPSNEMATPEFVGLTSFILVGTFMIAIVVERLDLVLGFVGATGSTTISFILPSAFIISPPYEMFFFVFLEIEQVVRGDGRPMSNPETLLPILMGHFPIYASFMTTTSPLVII